MGDACAGEEAWGGPADGGEWGCQDLLPFNQVGRLILRLFPKALRALLLVLLN